MELNATQDLTSLPVTPSYAIFINIGGRVGGGG